MEVKELGLASDRLLTGLGMESSESMLLPETSGRSVGGNGE